MGLAKFLDEKLLEPKRQQIVREYAETFADGYTTGRAEGRAEAIAQVRSWLAESGINLDAHISSAELHAWLSAPRERRIPPASNQARQAK